jgi:integrase
MKEVSKRAGKSRGVRHALTLEQQRAFMDYIANHPVYYHWWPLFTVLLGTGCRIGEGLGLRWQDLDFEKRTISINHSLVYYPEGSSRRSVLKVSKPKTEAGIRIIPMLDIVYDAFQMELEEQEETGYNQIEIDGMTGFIFTNRNGSAPNPQTVNRTIKRIISSYNADEVVRAKRQRREPIILPDFSCHHLRHTFCTRLCENETNLKVIQAIMGHRNIETTMDIYAEATEQKKQESIERLSSLNIF